MRIRPRLLGSIFAAIALIAVAAVVAGYAYLRRSLPVLRGAITVPGISAPVDIVRDEDAVTHVFAATKRDAFYGLGYAHAQDRLWQMEFQRRVGFGRLSEVLGTATVGTDRFLRTLGTGRAARSAWNALPEWAQADINAYVAGVNEFIATHHGSRLPLEFTLLRFEPEPWTGPDVLAWVKMMAWDLSKNYSLELLRHDLIQTVGTQRTDDLLPPYPMDGLTILSERDMPWLARKPAVPRTVGSAVGLHYDSPRLWSEAFASTVVPGAGGALGSNNWVVDGTMTASGKPMLANDPHLGAQIPSLWYLAHLSAGDFDVVGATLPGAPAIAIGRNTFIAWGETNVMADVQDLFRERLDAAGTHSEFRGAQEPVQIVKESIKVKGAAAIPLDVRITRHGPLISDAINANNAESPRLPRVAPLEPLAFRWTALDPEDGTIAAFLRLNEARNWTEFTGALRGFVVPAQNFVYADVDGHIGYYAPGHFPIRASGDGSTSMEGWTGLSEWNGWVPFDELPHAFDPPEHFIASANEKPAPASYPHAISGEFIDPHRARRIVDLLAGKTGLTPNDFGAMQFDTLSLHAQTLLPILLKHAVHGDGQSEQALARLRRWNFDERGDSAAAAIYQAWYYELMPAIAGDEIGPALTSNYHDLDRSSYVSRFLLQTLQSPDNPWCDDVRTPAKETCDQIVVAALQTGLARLTQALGSDMTTWRWDGVHHAVFAHSTLDTIPVLGRWLRRSAPHGGDWNTVNVGPVFAPKPFEQHSVPGYRQVIDLSPTNDSRFLDAVGQSGHVLSPRYSDALQDWSAGRERKMRMTRADVDRGAIGTLRLIPVHSANP